LRQGAKVTKAAEGQTGHHRVHGNFHDPLDLATGVALNSIVNVTFSEAMDPATFTVDTLRKAGTTAVSGAVTYDGKTATFTPASNLDAGTAYTATITTGVKDKAGNVLSQPTPGHLPPVPPPTLRRRLSVPPSPLTAQRAWRSTASSARFSARR